MACRGVPPTSIVSRCLLHSYGPQPWRLSPSPATHRPRATYVTGHATNTRRPTVVAWVTPGAENPTPRARLFAFEQNRGWLGQRPLIAAWETSHGDPILAATSSPRRRKKARSHKRVFNQARTANQTGRAPQVRGVTGRVAVGPNRPFPPEWLAAQRAGVRRCPRGPRPVSDASDRPEPSCSVRPRDDADLLRLGMPADGGACPGGRCAAARDLRCRCGRHARGARGAPASLAFGRALVGPGHAWGLPHLLRAGLRIRSRTETVVPAAAARAARSSVRGTPRSAATSSSACRSSSWRAKR